MSDQEAHRQPGTSEEEPLLGGRGDASQQEGLPLYRNFVIGKHIALQTWRSLINPKTDHE